MLLTIKNYIFHTQKDSKIILLSFLCFMEDFMNRENVITIISEPKNEDVIVYDTTLIDLLDVNVFQEYRSTLNLYKLKKDKYILLDKEVKQYQEIVRQLEKRTKGFEDRKKDTVAEIYEDNGLKME